MAKFVKKTSDLAEALKSLEGLANNFIAAQTNRQIQLGREKENRQIKAYQYMLDNENREIAELETALSSIEANLMDKGVEIKSVKDQYKTPASEELLLAANEGAMELISAQLADRKRYKESLENKRRESSNLERQINMIDEKF